MKPGVPEFLAARSIAVVGVSRSRGFGNYAFRELAGKGYKVYPVNAEADSVEGQPCFRCLAKLPETVDAALVVVPPRDALKIVQDCIFTGIKRIWLQQGTESPEAIQLAETNGISVVHHACILMYAQPSSFHRVHRWINRVTGRL